LINHSRSEKDIKRIDIHELVIGSVKGNKETINSSLSRIRVSILESSEYKIVSSSGSIK
jgi:hypothetical protein